MMKFREVRGTPMSRGTEPPLVPPPQVNHHPHDNDHINIEFMLVCPSDCVSIFSLWTSPGLRDRRTL